MSEISTRNHPKSTSVVTVAAKAFIMHIRTLRQFSNEKKTNIRDFFLQRTAIVPLITTEIMFYYPGSRAESYFTTLYTTLFQREISKRVAQFHFLFNRLQIPICSTFQWKLFSNYTDCSKLTKIVKMSLKSCSQQRDKSARHNFSFYNKNDY